MKKSLFQRKEHVASHQTLGLRLSSLRAPTPRAAQRRFKSILKSQPVAGMEHYVELTKDWPVIALTEDPLPEAALWATVKERRLRS
jgi:uncharacterized protein DUF3470